MNHCCFVESPFFVSRFGDGLPGPDPVHASGRGCLCANAKGKIKIICEARRQFGRADRASEWP
jgi:hypothetical protein